MLTRLLTSRPTALVFSLVHSLRNELQYGRFLRRQTDQPVLFVHSPKTAGRAIAESLGLEESGHFTLERMLAVRTVPVEKIIFSYRDPADRIVSIFKMARKPIHQRWSGALVLLNRFETVDAFIRSPLFPCLVRWHYFFRPQAHYLAGILDQRVPVHAIDFARLVQDVQDKFGVAAVTKNVSPSLDAADLQLSREARAVIERLYAEDYDLIRAVRAAGV